MISSFPLTLRAFKLKPHAFNSAVLKVLQKHKHYQLIFFIFFQAAVNCLKTTMETPEQRVKSVQS